MLLYNVANVGTQRRRNFRSMTNDAFVHDTRNITPSAVHSEQFSSGERFYGLVNQTGGPVIRGQFIGSVRRAGQDEQSNEWEV